MEVKKVGVLGCGLMGSGIAQVAATSGYQVTCMDVMPAALEKAQAASEDAAQRMRSVAAEVKDAAKLVEDAKRTVEKASEELEKLFRDSPGR